MVEVLASGLTNSSRETLSVVVATLVALALGVIIQGRIVDEHVDPPGEWRPRLVVVEILAASIFFVAALTGVYLCLYSLAANRMPAGSDVTAIKQALLTTAFVAFFLTIVRRALPACWPAGSECRDPEALASGRWAVLISTMLVLVAAPLTVELDTAGRFVLLVILTALAIGYLTIGSWVQLRLGKQEGLLAFRLGRQAWTSVETQPVRGGPLEGAQALPVAFVLVSQDPADRDIWLSKTGLQRIRALLRQRHNAANVQPVLRWQQRRKRVELISPRSTGANGIYVADVVVVARESSGLFHVEPRFGLIEQMRDDRPLSE